MDYLKVDLLGGMHLEAEDWAFNQNGLKEALKGMASVAGSNYILSGVLPLSVSPGIIGNPEGFVVIEGEIFYVPLNLQPNAGTFRYLEVKETFDPNGLEVFEDGGSPQNTYIKRTAKVTSYATAQAITTTRKLLSDLKTFAQQTADNVADRLSDFSYSIDSLTPLQDFTIGALVAKNRINEVTFIGQIKRNLKSGDAATLPLSYRPLTIKSFVCSVGTLIAPDIVVNSPEICTVTITPDGIVSILGLTVSGYAMLSSIKYNLYV